ncbi:hypothetical protein [Ectothiorhodospira sp. BSL-9]|uniref:hypothetical protein n=1 Tax=Ectothiorhodospira sp. BSL-9 TaxID=1442136 RepID=UPI0007B42BEC|nr:hypothetical protein [Ectothiorhodospira sp. BSL-9]ANB02923.1 hypothetical protein ECTOBSL9_2447 [Ectothiorhodospira sp. BSL-9]TVQ74482.1 MAG: hypothetical protein EA372_02465 [Chromatiaceae bacterium]
MATKKLLAKLGKFLDADRASQRKEIQSIRKVLKKLKHKERDLREKLPKTPEGEERDDIAAKLEVIYAQRRKGVDRVKELRGVHKPGEGKDTAQDQTKDS